MVCAVLEAIYGETEVLELKDTSVLEYPAEGEYGITVVGPVEDELLAAEDVLVELVEGRVELSDTIESPEVDGELPGSGVELGTDPALSALDVASAAVVEGVELPAASARTAPTIYSSFPLPTGGKSCIGPSVYPDLR